MTKARRPAQDRGFTLVEVLVAMLILAIMAAMAWRGVDSMARSREMAQEHLGRTLRVQSVIAQWEADLQAVVDTQTVPALGFDGATLRMTRTQPQGVQMVLWSLHGNRWLRWAGPVVTTVDALQEQWMSTMQFQGQESGQLVALEGVDRWQVYCFRGATWSNCQSTGNIAVTPVSSAGAASQPSPAAGASAPPAAPVVRQALPSGVRLRLQFLDNAGFGGPLTRDVAMLSGS